MTASAPETGQGDAWRRHADGRWIVGDPGRQPEMVPAPEGIAPGRPDTTIDGARLGDTEYRAVSLRGLSHWAKREPRQDAYLLRVSDNQQWLVGCVADGVSAARYSHLAADLACREITREIADALAGQPAVTGPDDWAKLIDGLPWQHAVDRASAAITAKASAGFQGAAPDAGQVRGTMSTTAVGFAVAATATPEGLLPFTVAVAAGDSSALVLSGGRWLPVTAVKNAGSEIASNAVAALPRAVEVTPVSGALGPGEALVVVSDGIGEPLGTGTGEVGRFLAWHWSRPPDLLAFAGHAAFYRRGFADDRTAVVVWNLVPVPETAEDARPDTAARPEPGDGGPEPGDGGAPPSSDEGGHD